MAFLCKESYKLIVHLYNFQKVLSKTSSARLSDKGYWDVDLKVCSVTSHLIFHPEDLSSGSIIYKWENTFANLLHDLSSVVSHDGHELPTWDVIWLLLSPFRYEVDDVQIDTMRKISGRTKNKSNLATRSVCDILI